MIAYFKFAAALQTGAPEKAKNRKLLQFWALTRDKARKLENYIVSIVEKTANDSVSDDSEFLHNLGFKSCITNILT